LKQIIPKVAGGNRVRKTHSSASLVRAAEEFVRLHPDYADTETNFELMCAAIERQGLDPTSVADLGRAWSFVKKITANDPKSVAPAVPVHPTHETTIPELQSLNLRQNPRTRLTAKPRDSSRQAKSATLRFAHYQQKTWN
jgi:hypothetical protein